MSSERATFEQVLDALDRVLGKLGTMHAKPRDFGTGVVLHRAEIHTVQAIGHNRGINVTRLVTHRFDLEQIQGAFDVMKQGESLRSIVIP